MSRIAVLLHGAGSCPKTAVRLLGPAVPDGVGIVSPAWHGSVRSARTALEDAVAGGECALVAGISLGAHAAAAWAAATRAEVPLLLAMPAWTDVPDDVAAATLVAADDVAARGAAGVLAGLRADPTTAGDWVVDELARGWAEHDDAALARCLRAAGRSRGPGTRALTRIAAPTAVVALLDDPLHPAAVARGWAAAIPGAALVEVPRDAPGRDAGALGRAGAQALAVSGSR